MIKFEINEQKYESPDSWAKVKYSKFLDYLDKVKPLYPDELKGLFAEYANLIGESDRELSDSEASFMFTGIWEAMPVDGQLKCYEFFAEEIGFWCNLDSKLLLSSINKEFLLSAYLTIQYEMNPNNFQYDESFAGFEIMGTFYHPPKKHMEGSTVLEFSESAQFQANMEEVENGNWLAMLDVMVVLCRPEGEVYNYEKTKHEKRKALFRELPMDNVINVAFFLLKLKKTLNYNLAIYTMEQDLAAKEVEHLSKSMDGQV